jgi:phage terminase Nu1 subunit (DNA packaging protein)
MTTAEAKRMAQTRWQRVRATEGESEAEARRRWTRAKADRAELEVRVRRGELVERAKVERMVFGFARSYRDALQRWPARVAATVAARLGADAHVVGTVLAEEVRAHLEELSREPLPRLGGEGAAQEMEKP